VLIRALILSLCLCAAAAAQDRNEWTRPFPPFKLIGNVYWVGTYDLSTFLITTDAGHVLINTGFAETVPLIEAGVQQLGFEMDDELAPAPDALARGLDGRTRVAPQPGDLDGRRGVGRGSRDAFRYPIGDPSGRGEAQAYGRSVGVPEPQLDRGDHRWRRRGLRVLVGPSGARPGCQHVVITRR